jgi:cell division protein FtsQ
LAAKREGGVIMKRFIRPALWTLFLVGIIALTGFSVGRNADRVCENLKIAIDYQGGGVFITEEDIKEVLQQQQTPVFQQHRSEIDVLWLEQQINKHPAVQIADVFSNVNGDVTINMTQRKPIARIVTVTNESYYMDSKGFIMPWSDKYAAPLLLINGRIADSYGNYYPYNFSQITADSALKTTYMLDDAWHVAEAINADSFLTAQIAQVYISSARSIELIPRIGSHIIKIGDVTGLDKKLQKLILFYRKGLSQTGRWEDYAVIDLRFNNQIVCTKKQ